MRHVAGWGFLGLVFIPAFFALVLLSGCRKQPASAVVSNPAASNAPASSQEIATVSTRRNQNKYPQLLSDYKLYRGEMAKLDAKDCFQIVCSL